MDLKKIGKVFTSKFVGPGPSSYKKIIYRAAVSQRLGNTDVNIQHNEECIILCNIFWPVKRHYQDKILVQNTKRIMT
jgi:hypothetical protein